MENILGTHWNFEETPWEHIGKQGKMKKMTFSAPQT